MAAEERSFQEPDYDYYDLEDEEEEGGRGPILVVVAIIVLTAFVGVVLVAYNQGVREGRQQMPPILRADTSPVKEAPIAGNESGSGASLSQQALAGKMPAESETMAPPPEEPMAKPPVATPAPVEKAPPIAAAPVKKVEVQAAADPATAPAAAASDPTPAPAAPAPAALAAVSSPAVASGAYLVQIGSFKSEPEALSTWEKLKVKHQDVLGAFSPNVARADLGAKGVYQRLRFGPFETKEQAQQVCDQLKARKQGCLLAKP